MQYKKPEYCAMIEDYINSFRNRQGSTPSVRQIASGVGLAVGTVSKYLSYMRENGVPKFAEENIEEYVCLPESLFGRGEFFLLRARGDSMIGAGIEDGDLVLIRQQNTAEYNQIVVALVDDEATLKRFRPNEDHICLHPENNRYEDIIVDSCLIQGVAVKVIKDLD